jgi:hypothetical protein
VGCKSIEKDEDVKNGKTEGRGKENAEERVEGKGKAQESRKGEEGKPKRKGRHGRREETGLMERIQS